MNYTPPNKILVTSDGSIMEYVRVIKNKAEDMYVYRFVDSLSNKINFTKMNLEFPMTEKFIQRQLTNFFKEIQ